MNKNKMILMNILIATSIFLTFQNCSKLKLNDINQEKPFETFSTVNPLCSPHSNFSISVPKEEFDSGNLSCTESFKLRDGLKPGLVCDQGPTILNLPTTSLDPVDCASMTICGTNFNRRTQSGSNYVLEFSNIPLGCDSQIEITNTKTDTVIFAKNYESSVSSCPKCEVLNKYTCGECSASVLKNSTASSSSESTPSTTSTTTIQITQISQNSLREVSNGECGIYVNSCVKGKPINMNPGSCGSNSTWLCASEDGGKTSALCSFANEPCTPPKNGVCGLSVNTCSSGSAKNINPGSCGGSATWICSGSNGGTDSSTCSVANPECQVPVNGVCGTIQNTCAPGGTAINFSAGSCDGSATWSCKGANNGTTAYCSLPNPSCCVATKGQSCVKYYNTVQTPGCPENYGCSDKTEIYYGTTDCDPNKASSYIVYEFNGVNQLYYGKNGAGDVVTKENPSILGDASSAYHCTYIGFAYYDPFKGTADGVCRSGTNSWSNESTRVTPGSSCVQNTQQPVYGITQCNGSCQ